MTFNTARNILAVRFYGTEEGKEINRILNEVDENPWHTGTPTKGGLYFVYDKYAGYGKRELPEDIEAKDLELVFTHIVAWQKIEPYKEEKEE